MSRILRTLLIGRIPPPPSLAGNAVLVLGFLCLYLSTGLSAPFWITLAAVAIALSAQAHRFHGIR